MLYPHSLLWHYLWVGPDILEAVLALLLWRRGAYKVFPVFFFYLSFNAIEDLALYGMDILQWVSADAWWRAACSGLAIEGSVRIVVVWEVFSHLVRSRPAAARMGNWLICWTGAILVALAAMAANHAPIDSPFWLSHVLHILEQTMHMIESGLWLFLFLFAAYFRLGWNNRDFGVALGSSISACVGLGTWAIAANGGLLKKGYLLDFLNMATYHLTVLVWFYYLLRKDSTAEILAANPPVFSKAKPDEPTAPADRRLLPAWFRPYCR